MGFSFVHTSDWHLGFTQYNKPERFDDFFQAALKTVDKIIELDPDFVLHSGDIFHHPRPTPAAIRQAIIVLQKLDQAGIPTYVVRGNHDGKDSIYLSRGGGIITLLKELKLLQFVDDEVVSIPNLGCQIMGIGYYPGRGVSNKIDEIVQHDPEFMNPKVFSILSLHAFVEGQLEDYAQVSLASLSDLGVDYIAAGHYHIPWFHEEKRIYAPGSSETTAITDINRGDLVNGVSLYSSFIEVHLSKGETGWNPPEITTHRVPVRPKIKINHSSEAVSAEAIKEELDELLEEKIDTILLTESRLAEKRPILWIHLETQLEFEENSRINLDEWYQDEYLHIISTIDGKSNETKIVEDLKTSYRIEEVFLDLLEMHNLDQEVYLPMLLDLVREFGDHPPSRDINPEIVKSISDLLLRRESTVNLAIDIDETVDEEKSETAMETQTSSVSREETVDDVFDQILSDMEEY